MSNYTIQLLSAILQIPSWSVLLFQRIKEDFHCPTLVIFCKEGLPVQFLENTSNCNTSFGQNIQISNDFLSLFRTTESTSWRAMWRTAHRTHWHHSALDSSSATNSKSLETGICDKTISIDNKLQAEGSKSLMSHLYKPNDEILNYSEGHVFYNRSWYASSVLEG